VVSPRQTVPGVGWVARVDDSEGNLIGLIQPDPKAGT
jgi:predicted enzyme related to lactoylglutathione lyase